MAYDLYVVTDEVISGGRTHTEIASEAVRGGADAIQLRDKKASGKALLKEAKAIRRITQDAGVLFIVNDRFDIALLSNADGVHLGQDDLPISEVRPLCPPGFLIGISVSTVAEAIQAQKEGADYLGPGPIFSTTSKDDARAECGLDILREMKAAVSIPLVAIGGINSANLQDVIRSGADGAAVISAVVAQKDIASACRELRALVRKAKE